jgi:hypothetical protein
VTGILIWVVAGLVWFNLIADWRLRRAQRKLRADKVNLLAECAAGSEVDWLLSQRFHLEEILEELPEDSPHREGVRWRYGLVTTQLKAAIEGRQLWLLPARSRRPQA